MVYDPPAPPWYGKYPGHDQYKGQTAWWAEAGYKDYWIDQKKWRLCRPKFREQDPFWFDPPVEDGKSVLGARGIDTMKVNNQTLKGDTPIHEKEFQKEMYENNFQIKNIKSLYKISPEHPGMRYLSTIKESNYVDPSLQGRTWTGVFNLTQWGPKFFNKPQGEGCFEKTFACARYAFYGTLIFSQVRSFEENEIEVWRQPRTMLKYFLKYGPWPIGVAAMWGASICAACSFREKDDWKNVPIAGAAAGAVWGTKQASFGSGAKVFLAATILGLWWQARRDGEEGLAGPQPVYKWWHIPLGWTLWDQKGDHFQIPEKRW